VTKTVVFNSSQSDFSISISLSDRTDVSDEYLSLTLVPPQGLSIANNSDVIIILTGNVRSCTDIKCHEEAVCVMNGSSPFCKCVYPFVGDGVSCQLQNPCFPDVCHENATCVLSGGSAGSVVSGSGSGGSEVSNSGSHGSAVSNQSSQEDGQTWSGSGSGSENVTCRCVPQFVGNGTHCLPDPCNPGPCSRNAVCERVVLNDTMEANCTCLPAFIGDGRTCIRE
jgi:hypothetical protein